MQLLQQNTKGLEIRLHVSNRNAATIVYNYTSIRSTNDSTKTEQHGRRSFDRIQITRGTLIRFKYLDYLRELCRIVSCFSLVIVFLSCWLFTIRYEGATHYPSWFLHKRDRMQKKYRDRQLSSLLLPKGQRQEQTDGQTYSFLTSGSVWGETKRLNTYQLFMIYIGITF